MKAKIETTNEVAAATAKLVRGNSVIPCNKGLSEALMITFGASTAGSGAQGIDRGQVATWLAGHLQALGTFDAIELVLDSGSVRRVANQDLAKVLTAISSAVNKKERIREEANARYELEAAEEESLYRSVISGDTVRRGRKGKSLDERFGLA